MYFGDRNCRGKDRAFWIIKNNTGLILCVVCSGCTKGGTSIDVKQGRLFFYEKLFEPLKVLWFKQFCGGIISIISLILKILSSFQLMPQISEKNASMLTNWWNVFLGHVRTMHPWITWSFIWPHWIKWRICFRVVVWRRFRIN